MLFYKNACYIALDEDYTLVLLCNEYIVGSKRVTIRRINETKILLDILNNKW